MSVAVSAGRLPWQRYHEVSGFIAYPNGEGRRDHFAAIWPEAGAHFGAWRWLARMDPPGKRPGDFTSCVWHNGVEPDKQAAADAATDAWLQVVEEALAEGAVGE